MLWCRTGCNISKWSLRMVSALSCFIPAAPSTSPFLTCSSSPPSGPTPRRHTNNQHSPFSSFIHTSFSSCGADCSSPYKAARALAGFLIGRLHTACKSVRFNVGRWLSLQSNLSAKRRGREERGALNTERGAAGCSSCFSGRNDEISSM